MLPWYRRLRSWLGCYGSTAFGCLGAVVVLVVLAVVLLPPLYRWHKGNSDLWLAVGRGDATAVRALLEAGADPDDDSYNRQYRSGEYVGPSMDTWETPLTLAVKTRRADIVRLLLDHGADVRRTGSETTRRGYRRLGPTALAVAVETGNTGVVALLLARGANAADTGTSTMQPVLCDAAGAGHAEVVRALLASGAAVRVRCAGGRSVLAMAREDGHIKIAELLQRAGARE